MKILLFGDCTGVKQVLRWLPSRWFCGIVMAENRPQYHKAVKKIAKKKMLNVLIQPCKTHKNYKRFVDAVQKLKPNLLLVHSYSMIISDNILKIADLGGLNIHASLLPKYRGCNPTEWAIINNEKETGISLHKLTSRIDAGDIFYQIKIPIAKNDTWKHVSKKINSSVKKVFFKLRAMIKQKNFKVIKHQKSNQTYFKRRKPSDAKINWRWSKLRIYNFIRAQVPPHYPAWTYNKNKKVKFFKKLVALEKIKSLKAQYKCF